MHHTVIFFNLLLLGIIIITLVTAVESIGETPHRHNCIHDSHIIKMLHKEDAEFPNGKRPTYEEYYKINKTKSSSSRSSAFTQSIGPLRIVLRTDSLYEPSKYCTTATGNAPDQLGGTAACSAETILTEEKRNILTQKLLPAAFKILKEAISVNTVTSPIKVPSTVCKLFDRAPADGEVGVSDADMVMYVSGAPTDGGSTFSTTVGWAAACMTNDEGRPIIGRANFSPKFLTWYEPDPQKKNEGLIKAAVHEFLHSLGFSEYLLLKSPKIADVTIRGKPTKWVTTTNAVSRYRSFTGCSTIGGVELEDQGGAGSALSHFERSRGTFDSIMVAAAGGVMALDEMTLAVLEDSGFYFPNYNKAEPMTWGKSAGCSFLTEKCDASSPQMGTYWCQEKSVETCSYDLRGYGVCSILEHTDPIPETYFRYFADDSRKGGRSRDFMDYCSYIVPFGNSICDSPFLTADESAVQRGEIFGFNGRCINVDDLAISAVVPSSEWPDTRCVLMRCPGGARVQIQLQTGDYFDCPTTGEKGWISAPAGYQGRIFCPAASEVCDAELYVPPTEATPAPPTPTPPTLAPGSTNPPPTPSPPVTPSPPQQQVTTTTVAPPPATTAKPQPPTAALVVTALKVSDPFNETFYKNAVMEITAASSSAMHIYKVSDTEIRVEFVGDQDELYANRLITAPTSQLMVSGFSSASATVAIGPPPSNDAAELPGWLSWVPMPLYIFLAIVIGGLLIIGIAICCCCVQWRRRRGRSFHTLDAESGHQNLAKQYREWQEDDDNRANNDNSEMENKTNSNNNNNSRKFASSSNGGGRDEFTENLMPTAAPAPATSPAPTVTTKKIPPRRNASNTTTTRVPTSSRAATRNSRTSDIIV